MALHGHGPTQTFVAKGVGGFEFEERVFGRCEVEEIGAPRLGLAVRRSARSAHEEKVSFQGQAPAEPSRSLGRGEGHRHGEFVASFRPLENRDASPVAHGGPISVDCQPVGPRAGGLEGVDVLVGAVRKGERHPGPTRGARDRGGNRSSTRYGYACREIHRPVAGTVDGPRALKIQVAVRDRKGFHRRRDGTE